jgi:hypothetical protein
VLDLWSKQLQWLDPEQRYDVFKELRLEILKSEKLQVDSKFFKKGRKY